jgi:hypothetical protein
MPVLGLYVLIRLLHDLLKNRQLDIAEPLYVHTDPARSVLA